MKMPHMPPYDWTRNEDTARKMVEDKLNEKESGKKPWEKLMISIHWELCLGALLVYVVWDLLIKFIRSRCFIGEIS